MDQIERDWCVGHISSEIMKDFATENEMLAAQNHLMNGDRPAAYSAATLFAKMPREESVREFLLCALTHVVEAMSAQLSGAAFVLPIIAPILVDPL